MEDKTEYKYVVLDIEGTVCPISFVKDKLFPYFLEQLPSYLDKYKFPLNIVPQNDEILQILAQFPKNVVVSKDTLLNHITNLVQRDIKDPVLKQLQGFIWEQGYTTGSIQAPLYEDAIEAMKLWSLLCDGVFIYSSGSVKAQKLLFANVETVNSSGSIGSATMNDLINDYFDTVNVGPKNDVRSYQKILEKIGLNPEDHEQTKCCLFLSDNPVEVRAAINAGMTSFIVQRPGNHPLSEEDFKSFTVIKDFRTLFN
ncbi:hypothetical protein CANINC_003075 [Pichia inconspicua]|uniref:Enolase-phosphatase E1 n=1 Tax=Pichia inconspicua TaxID=52247 RepID=A0A4V4NFK4_9ASCO|nr:hypothetical protein CANINC_003075 [[Candida] inconspicua]